MLGEVHGIGARSAMMSAGQGAASLGIHREIQCGPPRPGPLAQWQSSGLLIRGLWVRPPRGPLCDVSRDRRHPDPRFVGPGLSFPGGSFGCSGCLVVLGRVDVELAE